MGDFWANQYTEQRCENVYYSWMSKQEWAFASWLLCSHLSMVAIDSLLLLDIVRNNFQLSLFSDPLQIKCASLSFCSVKELRAHVLQTVQNARCTPPSHSTSTHHGHRERWELTPALQLHLFHLQLCPATCCYSSVRLTAS